MTRNKLYTFSAIVLLVGYAYLGYNATLPPELLNAGPTVCFIKNVTGVPCPSCGSTRSMVSFIRGDFASAVYWNPIGLLLLVIIIITPFWISFDVLKGKSSFFDFYQKMEAFLRRKPVIIAGVILLLANWIWNINKGL